MSEHAGFLQAIIENPDDDHHRVVYADWLDEQGQSLRAELIRTQCSLQRLMVDGNDPFDSQAYIEVMQLRPELRQPLLEPFSPLLHQLGEPDDPPQEVLATAFRFLVRRGFVEGLEIFGGQTTALFAREAATVLAQMPLLHVRIRREASRQGAADPMGMMPVGDDLLQARTLRALIDQECMRRLRTLDLSFLGLGDDAGRCLVRCRERLSLRRLNLQGNMFGEGVRQQLQQAFTGTAILPADDNIPF